MKNKKKKIIIFAFAVVLLGVFVVSFFGARRIIAKKKSIERRERMTEEFIYSHPVTEFDTLAEAEKLTKLSFPEAPETWYEYKMASYQALGEDILQITYICDSGATMKLRKSAMKTEYLYGNLSGIFDHYEYGVSMYGTMGIEFHGNSSAEILQADFYERYYYNEEKSQIFCVLFSSPGEPESKVQSLCEDMHNRYLEENGHMRDYFFDSLSQYASKWDYSKEAVQAYEDYFTLSFLKEQAELYGESGEPRFALGYVDDDDIPEALVAYGSYHGSPVYIYTIVGEKPRLVGRFGTYGALKYAPEKKNRIISSYGNQGYFITPVSQIIGGKAELVGCAIYNNGVQFFADYPMPEGLTGCVNDGWEEGGVPQPEKEYEITEDEYNAVYRRLAEGEAEELIEVSYNEMITIEDIYDAWK